MKSYELVFSYPATAYELIHPLDQNEGIENITAWIHQGVERNQPLTDQEWKNLIQAAAQTSRIEPAAAPFMIEESENGYGLTWFQNLLMKWFFKDFRITKEKLIRFWTIR